MHFFLGALRVNKFTLNFFCLPKPVMVLLSFAVSLTEGCNRHDHDPVCDKNGEEFTNFCVLLAKGRYLDFRGHCPVSNFVL